MFRKGEAKMAKLEGIQWVMTITNTLSNIFEVFEGMAKKVPDTYKQKLPGVLGLSLADEQIFGSVMGQLHEADQLLITDFLSSCGDHERNRFINVVAGMEVIDEGKINEEKESFDANGKKVIEKKSTNAAKKDTRKKFLEKFAEILEFHNIEFEKLTDDEKKKTTRFKKTHDYCVANRMMIPDPIHKQAEKMIKDLWEKEVEIIPSLTEAEINKLNTKRKGMKEKMGDIFKKALFLK